MDKKQTSNELSPQVVDHLTTVARGMLGIFPGGSLLAELVGVIIPNQRVDRIAKFADLLERKLEELEQDFVRSQFTNENFAELVEESMRQAARSVTDDRRAYIANLIVNSLSLKDIEYVESKHLLRILGEINDIEIIWLRFYLHPSNKGDEVFRDKHKGILEPVTATLNAPQEVRDKSALQKSYKEHLVQLGLLQHRYRIDPRMETPEFDRFTGGLKAQGYQISPLGRLLLKHIGLASADLSTEESDSSKDNS